VEGEIEVLVVGSRQFQLLKKDLGRKKVVAW